MSRDLATERVKGRWLLPIQTRVHQHKHTNMAALFILPSWDRGEKRMYNFYEYAFVQFTVSVSPHIDLAKL